MHKDDELIPLAKLVKGRTYQSVWGWWKYGRKASDGTVQRLVVVRTASGLASTIRELKNFNKRLNGIQVQTSVAQVLSNQDTDQEEPSQSP